MFRENKVIMLQENTMILTCLTNARIKHYVSLCSKSTFYTDNTACKTRIIQHLRMIINPFFYYLSLTSE